MGPKPCAPTGPMPEMCRVEGRTFGMEAEAIVGRSAVFNVPTTELTLS